MGALRCLDQAARRFGHQALAPMLLAQPIAELRRLALMVGEADDADQPLIEGEGEELELGDSLVAHYSGWLWDGESRIFYRVTNEPTTNSGTTQGESQGVG